MKIKINTGLIATNGDGKPSFRPPIPAGWCRPLAAQSSEEAQSVKLGVSKTYKSDKKMSENSTTVKNQAEDESVTQALSAPHQINVNGATEVLESKSEQNAAAASVSPNLVEDSQSEREFTAAESNVLKEQTEAPVNIDKTSSPTPSLVPAVSLASTASSYEVSSPLETSTKSDSLAVTNIPNITENEDSNVDVETEEQLAPLEGSTSAATSGSLGFTLPDNAGLLGREEGGQIEHPGPSQNEVSNCLSADAELDNMHSHKQDEEIALAESDAQYIEKEVVNSFLHQDRQADIMQNVEINVIESPDDAQNAVTGPAPSTSTSNPVTMSDTAVVDSVVGNTTFRNSGGNVGSTRQPEKIMDALSMTIASVAAGEGEPPEYISKFIPEPTKSKAISPYRQGHPNTSKHKKSRDRPMSASARLPVISSLLAPTSVAPHQSNVLPGIQHIAPSGRTSNSPNTVLPSVAHFLGPAKSPPSGYSQQQPQHSTADLLPPMGHQTGADLNHYPNTAGGAGPNSGVGGTPSSSGKANKGNRKPVTPAGLRLSMAASEELPDPLPVPQYSDKVIRAKQLGTVAFDRPTVLRETVQFFLQYKHYWSSHDYDRISNLVIELFPEFKDNSDTPGVPANKRIRTDLSMYARNFRRREVSQRKKDGGPSRGLSNANIDPSKSDQSISPTVAGPSSADNSFLHTQASPSQQQTQLSSGAVTAGNPANSTDFCNELLTAASIIESQNTSAGPRNGEMTGQMSQNHHKTKVSERDVASLELSSHKPVGLQEASALVAGGNVDGCIGNNGYHTQQQQRVMIGPEDSDSQPIHFVYDKDTVPAAASRDANAAWQMYSDQMAQAMAAGTPNMDYGLTEQAIKKDLGTCARNMRRRLPAAKYKPSSSQAQKTTWNTSSGEVNNPATGCGTGIESTQGVDATGGGIQNNPAEYMKALMAAQGMNLSELGVSQRNLGELAVLAGIKQRIEQHPTEVSDLERQYLAHCNTEERQALLSSGAFANDSSAMAALSAFYGQLGVDISSGAKRGPDYPSATVSATGVSAGVSDVSLGELLAVPNKRQRRISQAEVEKRLREAELNHVNQQGQHHLHHFQQLQQQQHLENVPKSSHQGTLGVNISDKHLVKREPSSPTGGQALKNRQQQNHHHLQNQHLNQHHQHQQLTVPSPVNMTNFSVSTANGMGLVPMSSSSASSAHDQAYWDSPSATNIALMGLTTSVAPLMATQAHSQAQVQHLSGHHHQGLSSSRSGSHEVPMNLTYHEADKTDSPSSQSSHTHHRDLDESPSVQEPLQDTAGLAAQVEVTTSAVKSPRRRASSSPRSGSQQGDSSLSQRDQVWFPHGQGFKKENQEVVSLPEPLPVPVYSQKIAAAREEGNSMRHRSEIIRETARFFLGLKYWWSSADYTRISELVVQHFPDLKDDSTGDGMNNYRRIQRDLSMCARNLRRSKKPRKMRELSSSDLAKIMMVDGEDSDQHHQGHVVENKKRPSRPKGTLYGAAAERKAKRQAGTSSARSKRAKLHQATGQASLLETTGQSAVATSVVGAESAGVGVTEDMTAAAALMQQQFMQQSQATSVSSGYISQHPSAHLLPTAHLMPSLHTHPALHGQHIQMNASLLQQEGTNITIEEAHSAKRLVKEEPVGTDSMDHTHSGIKANMVAPMQRALSPTLGLDADGQASAAAELAKQRILRDMEAGVMSREDADKLSQAQVQPASTLKVYMDPEHGSDLQERFSTLWRKGKFFDASLGVANKKLHVHKLVLLAMSPYLQETFKNADPRSQLEVNLPSDTTYETAKAFLKYIYEGVLEVDTSSVRSLHKIATMLQMNKLAQYCQNFAQQLQEETEQALQRLGETQMTSDLHRAARYATEEQLQFKTGYLSEAQQAETAATQPHFLHQDALAQHRALVAASSPTSSSHHQQHHHHQQQQNTSSSSELLLSSGGPASAQDLATQHLIQAALVRHQAGSPSSSTVAGSSSLYQQDTLSAVGGAVPVSDTNSALLQRLTSPALAAYWQAHTLTELMSRGGMTSDPSNQTSASELAAIAAAAASATTSSSSLPLTSSSEDQRLLGKGGGRGSGLHASHHQHHHQQPHHHQQQQHKDSQQWAQHADDTSHHHGSMLPETCLPGELSRGNS